jgi:hypothetical protein
MAGTDGTLEHQHAILFRIAPAKRFKDDPPFCGKQPNSILISPVEARAKGARQHKSCLL